MTFHVYISSEPGGFHDAGEWEVEPEGLKKNAIVNNQFKVTRVDREKAELWLRPGSPLK